MTTKSSYQRRLRRPLQKRERDTCDCVVWLGGAGWAGGCLRPLCTRVHRPKPNHPQGRGRGREEVGVSLPCAPNKKTHEWGAWKGGDMVIVEMRSFFPVNWSGKKMCAKSWAKKSSLQFLSDVEKKPHQRRHSSSSFSSSWRHASSP